MSIATPVQDEVPDVRTLDANDRCDRCGAQAYVLVRMFEGELLFCGHHAREHKDKIQGHIVIDETAKLNA